MATIELRHDHALGEEASLDAARELVDTFAGKLKAAVQWDGCRATFRGAGFSGAARVEPGRLEVDVELSMVMRPLKGKVEERLRRAVEERFPAAV